MELRLQGQFKDLKSGIITCQALQDHIAQLQKSNASLRESNSTRETSIAELSRARDELQNTKTFLEDRVIKLGVELRVLRDTPVVDLHAAAQQREAETKAAALRDEIDKLKAELEAEGERRRDQNEIEEGLRNEAETLRVSIHRFLWCYTADKLNRENFEKCKVELPTSMWSKQKWTQRLVLDGERHAKDCPLI